jgi:hypothetical protein
MVAESLQQILSSAEKRTDGRNILILTKRKRFSFVKKLIAPCKENMHQRAKTM